MSSDKRKATIAEYLYRIGTLWLLVAAGAAHAASVFEGVTVEQEGSRTVVRIVFTAPMRYQNHTPARVGRELRIVVKPLAPDAFPQSALYGRESRGWGADEPHPLRNLRYEGTRTTGSILTLQFARSIEFNVRSTPDLRSIVVTLPSKTKKEEVTQPADKTYSEVMGKAPAQAPVTRPVAPKGRYVLYLLSDTRPIDTTKVKRPEGFADKELFVSEADVRGRHWYRLTLGYFKSKSEAKAARSAISKSYPKAWIGLSRQAAAGATITKAARTGTLSGRDMGQVIQAGRDAMTDGKYRRAIRLFTAVLEGSDPRYHQEALELLGLARERLGQLAQAKAVYEKYLQRYPKGDDADRVRQRLAGVLTATPGERETQALAAAEKKAAKRRERPARWEWYGSLSQEYFRDQTTSADDPANVSVNSSRLTSSLDMTTRRRSADYDIRTRTNVQHQRDFISNSKPDTYAISDFYLEVKQKASGARLKVGRQRQNGSGVLGRFDGLLVGYPLSDTITSNFVAGFPVDLNDNTKLQKEISFAGLSADITPVDSDWSYNVFFIQQQNDGVLDRRAIGGEVRYFSDDKSLFTQFDYDLSYRALNIFLTQFNWNLTDRDTIYATFDSRLSPTLTTGNALTGQTARTLGGLLLTNTESQVRQLAIDRTPRTTSVTVGGSHRLREDLQVNGDITATRTGSTPASGGVAATPATDLEWLYSLQFIGNDLFSDGDSLILGLRYSNTTPANIFAFNVDARQPLPLGWRINPRVLVEYRSPKGTATSRRTLVKPSIRAEYKYSRNLEINLEGGIDWTRENNPTTGNTSNLGYFVSMGYRWDF